MYVHYPNCRSQIFQNQHHIHILSTRLQNFHPLIQNTCITCPPNLYIDKCGTSVCSQVNWSWRGHGTFSSYNGHCLTFVIVIKQWLCISSGRRRYLSNGMFLSTWILFVTTCENQTIYVWNVWLDLYRCKYTSSKTALPFETSRFTVSIESVCQTDLPERVSLEQWIISWNRDIQSSQWRHYPCKRIKWYATRYY